ncbi:hypothetical protein CBM2625_B110208 [Cupriavidus taiwanensis]|uniref:Uncharacterized protein n=1 Tax=Cupriavidus taiwanensis TaxID=164546 RepID=A0A375E749_9BURK|nr:hypothetical protein CBM2613_B110207 [Cupriavidus taiwanensis]SPA07933.1 hypothetical protein CBM2625_B110208 [Cupriavidus taiwanensis]
MPVNSSRAFIRFLPGLAGGRRDALGHFMVLNIGYSQHFFRLGRDLGDLASLARN